MTEKKNEFIKIFEILFNNFKDMYTGLKILKVSIINIFNNPFKCDVTSFELETKIELVVMQNEMEAPEKVNIEFWKNLDGTKYSELKKQSLKCLSLFSSTYI